MVSTVFNGEFRDTHRPTQLRALRAAWHGFLQRRANRLAFERLGPRLLSDIGLEPEQFHREGWDGLGTNGYLVKRRR